MTQGRLASALAFVGSAVLVLAACGPAGPSGTTAAVGTGAPASDRPAATTGGPFPSFDLGSFDLGSFALPSLSSDPELEAMLPDELGGVTVRKQSLTGAAFLATGMAGASAIQLLLSDLGKSAEDLSVGFGTTLAVTIIAYRIAGIPSDQLFAGLEAALAAAPNATVTDTTVGGRSLKQVVTPSETTYVYLADDVVFIIGGTLTPALVEEAVHQLPAG